MDNKRPLIAHLCLFCSGAFWGLMAPVGKDAMLHGIDGIDLVSFRVLGGALLFWLTSLFTKKEHVPVKDIFKFAAAGLFALVFNQCSYTIGLNMTSPSNSSIMTTSMPIFAMILSFLILKGAYHLEEGARCTDGMRWCRHHHHDKCYGGQCQGGKHLGRPALYVGSAFLRPLPVALQEPTVQVFALHHQQVDVPLGNGPDMAFHHQSRDEHRLCSCSDEHLVGNGLRGSLRHLSGLHLHDDWSEDPAPYRGECI